MFSYKLSFPYTVTVSRVVWISVLKEENVTTDISS